MQYKRKYRLIIGNMDVSNFYIEFTIEKAVKEDPQYAEISVINLSSDFANGIKIGTRVILEAGYEYDSSSPFGLIYTGEVLQVKKGRRDGVDTILTLTCRDGDAYLTSSFIAKTLAPGATATDVVGACASDGSVSIKQGNVSGDLSKQKLARSKTMFGKSRNVLRKVTRGNQAQFYVDGGTLNVIKAVDAESNKAFELNPATGLIGTPTQNEDGISGECLLNPQIRLNSLVYINGKLIEQMSISADSKAAELPGSGVYRIIKLIYTGDTRDGDWLIRFEALSQASTTPNLLKDGATNPWR